MSCPDEYGDQPERNEETALLMTEGRETYNNNNSSSMPQQSSSMPQQSFIHRKMVLAVLASICLFTLGMVDMELRRSNTNTNIENQVTGLAKEEYKLVDFHSGKATETRMVLDGNLTALVDHNLKMNCANKAMTGFNMVNYKNVYAAYKYTCDTGDAMANPNDRITDNTVAPGSAAKELSQFTLDCSKTGPNYVLTYMYLDKNTQSGRYQYEYGCATYHTSVLTCSQFYTDLAAETDVDDSVLHLADHPVECYDGSALQSVKYERAEGQVRYKFSCCSKNAIPTPSPTPLPTLIPVGEPTMEPISTPTLAPIPDATTAPVPDATAMPSLEPLAEPTLAPVADLTAEPTVQPSFTPPTELPTYEPTVEPSMAPVADATTAPIPDATTAPIPDATPMPTLEPVAEPTLAPIPAATEAPVIAPTSTPTTLPKADAILVESKHLPRYCPFTYLAGVSKVQSLAGCTFITRDQIVYMRNDETSPSMYVCTSVEDGEEIISHEDMVRYGLLIDGKGTVSDVRVGANTKLEVTDKDGTVLFTVTPEDQRLVHMRRIAEEKIWGAKLTTTTSAADIVMPSDCGDRKSVV